MVKVIFWLLMVWRVRNKMYLHNFRKMANGSVLQVDEFSYNVKVGIVRRKMENQ